MPDNWRKWFHWIARSGSMRDAEHEVKVLDINSKADYVIDICNRSQIAEALADFQPKVVFHIAAIADAREALNDAVQGCEYQSLGTASVLEAARKRELSE